MKHLVVVVFVSMNLDHWKILLYTVTVMDAMSPLIRPVMASLPFHKGRGFANGVKVKNVQLGW